MFIATHHPSKNHYEAQQLHKAQTGELLKVPKGVVARAMTPGGIFRQLFATYRKELSHLVMSESALTITHDRKDIGHG